MQRSYPACTFFSWICIFPTPPRLAIPGPANRETSNIKLELHNIVLWGFKPVFDSLMAWQQNAVCSISDNTDSLITLNVSIWHGIYTLDLATGLKRYQKEAPGTCLILKTHTKWFDQTETTQHLLAEMTFQWWRCRHPNIWLVIRPSPLTPTVIVCICSNMCAVKDDFRPTRLGSHQWNGRTMIRSIFFAATIKLSGRLRKAGKRPCVAYIMTS